MTVDETVDELVANARKALTDYEGFSRERVEHIVAKTFGAALGRFAELAQPADLVQCVPVVTQRVGERVGVIAGIAPAAHPAATVVFHALLALETRNPIIFAFDPTARRGGVQAARLVHDAAVAAGAPDYCVQWITEPSAEAAAALAGHPGIARRLTGGEPGYTAPDGRAGAIGPAATDGVRHEVVSS